MLFPILLLPGPGEDDGGDEDDDGDGPLWIYMPTWRAARQVQLLLSTFPSAHGCTALCFPSLVLGPWRW